MSNGPDPHVSFEPERLLEPVRIEPLRRWLPAQPAARPALDTTRWRTRAARGFSWHATGIYR